MSQLVVFAGPSVDHETVRARLPGVDVRPPARQGDILRATFQQPHAIGLIDGVFEHDAAVWHKEVLFALERGIRVFGAASMGALRAAELDRFGMVGVGLVYRRYAGGELERDDAVAVIHGPEEGGFRASSEALVNIVVTLEDAVAGGVVTPGEAKSLEAFAAETFYPERSWPRLLDTLSQPVRRRFERWLVHGERDVKREDALALLDALANPSAIVGEPPSDIRAVRSCFFVRALEEVLDEPDERWEDVDAESFNDTELRLRAWGRLAAASRPELRTTMPAGLVESATRDICQACGVETDEHFADWLEAQGLDEARFGELVAQRAALERAMRRDRFDLGAAIDEELKLQGHCLANQDAKLDG